MVNPDSNMEQMILETAERLFLEKGYALTSTTQIAKAVGCNQALVHYYFRTKENLFNTIFEKKFRAFFQQFFDSDQLKNLPFLEKLKKMVESHFDLLYENPQIPTLILNELSRQPEQVMILKEKLHSLPEQIYSQLDQELKAEIAAGRIRQVELIDVVITVLSLNIALFTIFPIASNVVNFTDEHKKKLILHRREENVKVLFGYLRP